MGFAALVLLFSVHTALAAGRCIHFYEPELRNPRVLKFGIGCSYPSPAQLSSTPYKGIRVKIWTGNNETIRGFVQLWSTDCGREGFPHTEEVKVFTGQPTYFDLIANLANECEDLTIRECTGTLRNNACDQLKYSFTDIPK